ncbi:MAG TPA: hypothetical protein PKN61_11865 [Acidobacteriota bacterium]|jgi:predicted HTH transcriptional regulator|nr:hypothetical protein [Acidobacteriota bacterium]HNR39724.1 hypothetical protein [Acidobacteriota bacterium]HNU01942.1 hypothetical protein [Acidobacteriota bacterium]HPB28762.1 hypothetical protein [Acidobacteriota bacterium]HQO24226.1 hypothetical protein [Acidobacteriota bacterium]
MSQPPEHTIDVQCPHCQSRLTVDRETGEVLLSKKHEKREVESFDSAVANARDWDRRKENLFEQAFEQEKKRKDMLEKKFREAQKQTEGDDSPPPKPFDFD